MLVSQSVRIAQCCAVAAHVQGVIRLVAYKTQRFPHSSQVSEVHFENVKQAGGSIF